MNLKASDIGPNDSETVMKIQGMGRHDQGIARVYDNIIEGTHWLYIEILDKSSVYMSLSFGIFLYSWHLR